MDVDYTPAKSIADLPISDPIHAPCPPMAGCVDFDPEKTENSLAELKRIREELGLEKKTKPVTKIAKRFYQPEEPSDFHKYGALGRL